MINKSNNISFKSVFLDRSVTTIRQKEREKLAFTLSCMKRFPQNDIFVGANNSGEAVFVIKHADKDIYMLDERLADVMKISKKDYFALVGLTKSLKNSYKKLWEGPEKFFQYTTRDIKNMTEEEIALDVVSSVMEFNDKYPSKEYLN